MLIIFFAAVGLFRIFPVPLPDPHRNPDLHLSFITTAWSYMGSSDWYPWGTSLLGLTLGPAL
jgi:hypothetical protein